MNTRPTDPAAGGGSKIQRLVKRGKWLVLAFWILVLVLTAPFVSKLNNRLDDTNSLPSGSQAAQVIALQKQADAGSEQSDLVVAYENRTGLTTADKQTIARQRGEVVAAKIARVTTVGAVIYSQDGQSAYLTVLASIPSDKSTGPDVESDIVGNIKKLAPSSGDLTARATGTIALDVDGNTSNADRILLVSAGAIVALLLLYTYRSAALWLIPLFSAALAISLTDLVVYVLTEHGLQMSTLDSSIVIVLVFGVATDYGMLLISRYREFLRTHDDINTAVALAVRGSFEAITASAATVALALLALLFAKFGATEGLGPVAAIGVVCAFIVQMTFLPAVLAIGGRRLLWPRAPRFDPNYARNGREPDGSRLWTAVGRMVARRPRAIAIGMTLLLAAAAIGLTQTKLTADPTNGLRGNPPSVQGEKILKRHFSELSVVPLIVVSMTQPDIAQAARIARQTPGTGVVSGVGSLAGRPTISIEPKSAPYSAAAFSYIDTLRAEYSRAGLSDVLVGGDQAAQHEYIKVTRRDNVVLIPIILLIVAVILGLLLRSIVAPILLLATVVLSFAGSFGLSVLIFDFLFHFASVDPAVPIYAFLFVVTLGVDYNIFLMDRARQETVRRGTRAGILHSLRVTGGVITAAGLVLAGTFAALAQLPIVTTTEVGVAVALGVLIDSILVRSLLLPAGVLLVGSKIWWPGRLTRSLAEAPTDALVDIAVVDKSVRSSA